MPGPKVTEPSGWNVLLPPRKQGGATQRMPS